MSKARGAIDAPAVGALLTAVAMLAGCGGADAERARRASELAETHAQLAELRRGQEAEARERGRIAEQLKAMDAQQAFLVTETKSVRDDITELRNQVAQAQVTARELRAAVDEADKKAEAAVATASTAPAVKAGAASAARDVPPDKLYAAAMASFRGDEHGQAVLEWGELVSRYPQHPLASNAQYWIGESYYRQRDMRQALVEFQKVVDEYPQSAQVPEALLKIGLCQRALKDNAAARESWDKVVKGYPATNAATQARALIGQLSGTGRGTR